MSAKEIAVVGCTFKTDPTGYTVTVLPSPASTMASASCGTKKVYLLLSFTIAKGDYAGAGVIVGSTTTVKGSSLPVLRKDDEITVVATQTVTPFATENVTVTIDNPGQTKAKAT